MITLSFYRSPHSESHAKRHALSCLLALQVLRFSLEFLCVCVCVCITWAEWHDRLHFCFVSFRLIVTARPLHGFYGSQDPHVLVEP